MILFISHADWANVGYLFAKSLQSVNVDALAVTKKRHPYSYPHQAQLIRFNEELQSLAKKADAIVWMHSSYVPLNIDLSGKKLAVFHGGSAYRKNYRVINALFNKRVDITFIQTQDLWDLGAERKEMLSPPVDIDYLAPVYSSNKPIVIGHFPSVGLKNPNQKGADVIQGVVRRLEKSYELRKKFKFICSTQTEPWVQHLKRIRACDIYIENLGKLGVGWGLTGLEAAAFGKILITRWLKPEVYFSEYTEPPLFITNDTHDLYVTLVKLIVMNEEERRDLRLKHRQWVKKYHSFKAVGKRLKGLLGV